MTLVSVHTEALLRCKSLPKYIDGLIPGYGEEPLAYFIKAVNDKTDFSMVPNLFYSSENTSFIKSLTVFAPDLAHLRIVPDFSNFIGAKELPIRLSMGCYWGKCAFCIYRRIMMETRPYMRLTPKEAICLVREYIAKYNIQQFIFHDDGPDPIFLEKFCELLIAENIKIQWRTFLCLDIKFSNHNITKLLKSAGCNAVTLGVESMVDNTLLKMKKMQKPEQVIPILESFQSAGIYVVINIIVGFPSETKEEFQKTIDFLLDNMHLYNFVHFYPYEMDRNDDIYRNPNNYQIDSIDKSDCFLKICDENE